MKVDIDFYREHYHQVLLGIIGLLFLILIMMSVIFYQILHRPLPQFFAEDPDHNTLLLIPNDEPNLMPDTILRWANKAATAAYTFDFTKYESQIAAVRPYFTEDGWQSYYSRVSDLINNLVAQQVFAYGVVSGRSVISNQTTYAGELPGQDAVWRVQIPFLVTYVGANNSTKSNYFVVMSIVRVPTHVNKQALGIDQFVMVG